MYSARMKVRVLLMRDAEGALIEQAPADREWDEGELELERGRKMALRAYGVAPEHALLHRLAAPTIVAVEPLGLRVRGFDAVQALDGRLCARVQEWLIDVERTRPLKVRALDLPRSAVTLCATAERRVDPENGIYSWVPGEVVAAAGEALPDVHTVKVGHEATMPGQFEGRPIIVRFVCKESRHHKSRNRFWTACAVHWADER